ncbi:hypothetical protein [Streptomyces sp. NPDC089799]|uniref:hypothetical protein n=1 Tax=Streptomyces sp. NPDC089799 TaxID=3155066 RepID=UPI00343B3401
MSVFTDPTLSAGGVPLGVVAGVSLAHSETLQNHPEWQKIKTIRGALSNVWEVMRDKAGPAWDSFRADARVQGWWRTTSIRACEAISIAAAALAKRLGPALPTADALLKLSDATITYSTVATAAATSTTPRTAAAPVTPTPPMQRLVDQPTPKAYATRDDALRAAHEVTERFRHWMQSPMGQAVAESTHPRVAAFREAWRSLPPAREAASGPAVGAYGNVAERAQSLVNLAVRSARHAPAEIQAPPGLGASGGEPRSPPRGDPAPPRNRDLGTGAGRAAAPSAPPALPGPPCRSLRR